MLDLLFRKYTGVLLLTIVLVALGIVLVQRLPIQLYPQTQRPRVRATISHDGISAVVFADDYAEQIESRFLGIDGVDLLEVSYENDRSSFTFTFDWETEPETARSDVETAMTAIDAILPARIQDSYTVRFFSGENAGYLIIGASSETIHPEALFEILTTSVQPILNTVEDAESVEVYPVEELRVDVTLRPNALLAAGLTIADVETAMRDAVSTVSIGTLDEEDRSYTVRYRRGSDTLGELRQVEIARQGNQQVRLQDVADISIEYDLPRRVFVMGGERGIQITATPIDGGNVRRMSNEIDNALTAAIGRGLVPEDTRFETFLDPADYIDRSIRNVVQAALLGALLAMIVVFIGLGEWHNTVLIGFSLPTTIVLSFILMYLFDVSLNLISLGGIALAVGMVIDSSIVVIENIHRLRLHHSPIRDNGTLIAVITEAVGEVRSPVIASTLTSVLVFLPISFTAPLTNAILGDQARTVVFSLSIALVVSLTVLPVTAFLMFRGRSRVIPHHSSGRSLQHVSHHAMNRVRHWYTSALRRFLRYKIVPVSGIIASGALLAAMAIFLLPLIPREIVSAPSSDRIVVFFGNSDLTDRFEIVETVVPEIQQRVEDRVGEYVIDTYVDVFGRFNRLFINLESSSVAPLVLGELQEEFQSEGAWYYNVMQWDPAQLPLPRTMDLQVNVQGDDPEEAVALLEELRLLVSDSELYAWSFTRPSTGYSDSLELRPRTAVIDRVPGYSESSLISLVSKILSGTTPVEYYRGSDSIEVSAQYPDDAIDGRVRLANLLVPYDQTAIPLKHFFDISTSAGVSGITSEDGERIFRLYAAMAPGTADAQRVEYERQIRDTIQSDIVVPPGYTITFDNPREELDEAIRSLFLALGASLTLVYLLLAFQFNSLRIPIVVLITVPLGMIGVIGGLYVFGSTLSLNSMLGAILLGGIVVNNAIIMIDFYLRLRTDSENRLAAVLEAARLRFVPIMMTMLTTVFGMLPIAIGMGEGSNIVQPLGIAVASGLVVSTFFTLFLVPGIMSLIEIGSKDDR
jgi:HAE1 family hydrophobic/amphiphilic exporter-1